MIGRPLVPSTMLRHEHIIEHVVPHPPAQDDRLRLVERPVDAEVDSALAVLFFSLGERREAAREEWPHVAIVAPRDSVKLVRDEGEGDVVGPVESAQGLKESGAESSVA